MSTAYIEPQAQARNERKIVAYAKQVDVSKIDSQLPKKRLADWLKVTLGPEAIIKWEVNDCGEQTGTKADRNRDLPFCAGIDAQMPDGRKVVMAIAVGTEKKGLTKESGMYFCLIEDGGHSSAVKELPELPKALSRKKDAFQFIVAGKRDTWRNPRQTEVRRTPHN